MEKDTKQAKKCRCTQCGWGGDHKLCDNGEYEPPTCLVCEASVITLVSDDNDNDNDNDNLNRAK